MANLLFPFDSWDEHTAHKQPRRHNSWQLVKRKEKKEAAELPAYSEPLTMSEATIPQMARREGPAGLSYSIHFIANMICLNGEAKAKTFLCGQAPL